MSRTVLLDRRPATQADIPFLLSLRRQTMDAHLAASGESTTDDAHMARLIYLFDCCEILLFNAEPVGLLKLRRWPGEWEVVQLQLIPRLQRQGLGRCLLEDLLAEAARHQVDVTLSVLKANPARHLYGRLGFTIVGEDAQEYVMRRAIGDSIQAEPTSQTGPIGTLRRALRGALMVMALCVAGPVLATAQDATRILVDKSDRTLRVYAGQRLIATYPVALGGNPVGHKAQEGDKRTPEGKYVLDYKNPNSAYHLSIHMSYPNQIDRQLARRRGVSPGGDVMIHGQPNNPVFYAYLQSHQKVDWTDGCIALSNQDMKALWDIVSVPVPVEIAP